VRLRLVARCFRVARHLIAKKVSPESKQAPERTLMDMRAHVRPLHRKMLASLTIGGADWTSLLPPKPSEGSRRSDVNAAMLAAISGAPQPDPVSPPSASVSLLPMKLDTKRQQNIDSRRESRGSVILKH
jgi:hypothetical protein